MAFFVCGRDSIWAVYLSGGWCRWLLCGMFFFFVFVWLCFFFFLAGLVFFFFLCDLGLWLFFLRVGGFFFCLGLLSVAAGFSGPVFFFFAWHWCRLPLASRVRSFFFSWGRFGCCPAPKKKLFFVVSVSVAGAPFSLSRQLFCYTLSILCSPSRTTHPPSCCNTER